MASATHFLRSKVTTFKRTISGAVCLAQRLTEEASRGHLSIEVFEIE